MLRRFNRSGSSPRTAAISTRPRRSPTGCCLIHSWSSIFLCEAPNGLPTVEEPPTLRIDHLPTTSRDSHQPGASYCAPRYVREEPQPSRPRHLTSGERVSIQAGEVAE